MVVALLPLLGFAATVLRRNDRGLLLLVAPQFLVLSLVPGFIQDGALSKYPLGLMSSLALLGGSGLTFLWQKTAQIMKLPFTRIDLFLPLL
ncbi:MAG: hypothetical protein GWN86_02640, partial [Desulfobacterales bacterium]|nr:hypothetical protein [Desulfobacterales bacterium]